MLTFTKFGRYGNLGNQLFQYASLLGLAYDYSTGLTLPGWDQAYYFNIPPVIKETVPTHFLEEPHFHYCPEAFDALEDEIALGVLDVKGWFQSEKYWAECKPYIMDHLRIQDNIVHKVMEPYAHLFKNKYKPTIAISIRRGDYVDNPYYELLPPSYYYLALFQYFPYWRDANILIFSDDIPYCKVHFSCMPNVTFMENLNPMDQLIVGAHCDHFIIANSTFSWWMAYMGQMYGHTKDGYVIRPTHYYAGEGLKNDTRDHYPDHWIPFDHFYGQNRYPKRLDMKDVTFIFPCHNDSPDRKENIYLVTNMIRQDIETNIIIGEQGRSNFKFAKISLDYVQFHMDKFHRTHMINHMTAKATTPYIINYDADILTPPLQIYLAIEQLRNDQADFVYPYDGRFARCPRQWVATMQKYQDVGTFRDVPFKGTAPKDGLSVGGVIAYRKDKFIDAGGENEKMISYAPEDQERYYRFAVLGYRVTRIRGIVYHLDHQITPNSSTSHPDYQANEEEFTFVKSLTHSELLHYVCTWHYFG
jgi:hypothetical protein